MFPAKKLCLFPFFLWTLVVTSEPGSQGIQECSLVFLSITTNGDQPVNRMTCRGTHNSARAFTCKPNSCQGTTTCKTCTSQLTNASVASAECSQYFVDDEKKTNCWTSSDEQFTCTGPCDGTAACSECDLDEETPSICTSSKLEASHKGKAPTTPSGGDNSGGVTTWLAWN